MIDISVPTSAALPIWPGSPGFEARRHLEIARGDDANASEIRMDLHVGTHVDAPLHFVEAGADLETVGLDPFVGPATVVDAPWTGPIDAKHLESLGIEPGVTRLLLRTNKARPWFREPFNPDFPALSESGARWIVDRGLTLVGIDYLSIQRFADGPEAHQVLLSNEVCIIEGLDLRAAKPGAYDLFCLPIRLASAEAAPARAILRSID